MTDQDEWLSRIVGELREFYEPQPEPPHDAFGFYLWYVLGRRAVPVRRDAALAALRRIPAMTPDALWKAPRAKLHAAVAHVGPPEERLNAVIAGVEAFRRHRDLDHLIAGPLLSARRATRTMPALGPVGAQWMLLAVGGHAILPRHPGVGRVGLRLGVVAGPSGPAPLVQLRAARAMAAIVPRDVAALKNAVLYLSHHASVTCAIAHPHCRVCPLTTKCEAYKAAAAEN